LTVSETGWYSVVSRVIKWKDKWSVSVRFDESLVVLQAVKDVPFLGAVKALLDVRDGSDSQPVVDLGGLVCV